MLCTSDIGFPTTPTPVTTPSHMNIVSNYPFINEVKGLIKELKIDELKMYIVKNIDAFKLSYNVLRPNNTDFKLEYYDIQKAKNIELLLYHWIFQKIFDQIKKEGNQNKEFAHEKGNDIYEVVKIVVEKTQPKISKKAYDKLAQTAKEYHAMGPAISYLEAQIKTSSAADRDDEDISTSPGGSELTSYSSENAEDVHDGVSELNYSEIIQKVNINEQNANLSPNNSGSEEEKVSSDQKLALHYNEEQRYSSQENASVNEWLIAEVVKKDIKGVCKEESMKTHTDNPQRKVTKVSTAVTTTGDAARPNSLPLPLTQTNSVDRSSTGSSKCVDTSDCTTSKHASGSCKTNKSSPEKEATSSATTSSFSEVDWGAKKQVAGFIQSINKQISCLDISGLLKYLQDNIENYIKANPEEREQPKFNVAYSENGNMGYQPLYYYIIKKIFNVVNSSGSGNVEYAEEKAGGICEVIRFVVEQTAPDITHEYFNQNIKGMASWMAMIKAVSYLQGHIGNKEKTTFTCSQSDDAEKTSITLNNSTSASNGEGESSARTTATPVEEIQNSQTGYDAHPPSTQHKNAKVQEETRDAGQQLVLPKQRRSDLNGETDKRGADADSINLSKMICAGGVISQSSTVVGDQSPDEARVRDTDINMKNCQINKKRTFCASQFIPMGVGVLCAAGVAVGLALFFSYNKLVGIITMGASAIAFLAVVLISTCLVCTNKETNEEIQTDDKECDSGVMPSVTDVNGGVVATSQSLNCCGVAVK